jgi:hypothetical protein
MDTVTVMAGDAAAVIGHSDGAKAEKWAGVDEAALPASGSRAAAREGAPRQARVARDRY